MPHVQATTKVLVDPETLWRRVGSFQGVGDWHPMLASVVGQGEQSGAIRRAKSRDGQEQVERLEEMDPLARFYRYSIVSTPMPVRDYVAQLNVVDNHDGTSTVVWTSDFQVDFKDETKTVAMVQGFLNAGLDALKAQYSLARTT